MLGLTRRVRVFAYPGPVDMRKSFFTLMGLATEVGYDVIAGDVFIFVARNRRLAKVLWFDGTGLVLLAKRLEVGRFAALWERRSDGCVELTSSQLMVFLEGSEVIGRASLVQPTYELKRQAAQK